MRLPRCAALCLALIGSVDAGAATRPSPDPELLLAVRAGDAARVRTLLRTGHDVNASTPDGRTALFEASQRGDVALARVLLDAGADPDARDRVLGTALDAAERAGHAALARLLRARGARGSGKSWGDVVCVRRWSGAGFCGSVEAAETTRYRLRVLRIVGCSHGCPADVECSAGRNVGAAGGLAADDTLWVRSWCLTHTGVR